MDEGSGSAPQITVAGVASLYQDTGSMAKRAGEPRIDIAADPASLIIWLSNPDLAAGLKKWPHYQIWQWKGKKYQMTSGD